MTGIKIKRSLLLSILLLTISFSVSSTPDPIKLRYIHPLGVIDDKYYILECFYENKGTYYEYKEKFSILEYEIGTDKLLNNKALRTVTTVFNYDQDGKKIKNKATTYPDENEKFPEIHNLEMMVLYYDLYDSVKYTNKAFHFYNNYRDSPGGYTVEVNYPEAIMGASNIKIKQVYISDNAYFLEIEFKDLKEINKVIYISINKDDFTKNIIQQDYP